MPIDERFLKKHHNTEGSAGQNNEAAEARGDPWPGLVLDHKDAHQVHTIQQSRFLKNAYTREHKYYVAGERPIDHARPPVGTSWATKSSAGFVFGAESTRGLSGARRGRKVQPRTYGHDELMAFCRPQSFAKGTTAVHFNNGPRNLTDANCKTMTGGVQKFVHAGDQHLHLPVRGGGGGRKPDWDNDDPAHSMKYESYLRSTNRKMRRGVTGGAPTALT